MVLSSRSTRFRLFVILGSFGIWLLAFFPLYSSIGIRVAVAPLAVPVFVAAWFYGLRGGLIASLVSMPVSIIMVNLADDTLTRWTILFSGSMAPATVFRVAVACLLGGLRDVYQKVKKSEAALEAANAGLEDQVATRTEELSRQREILSEAQSLSKFATTQRDFQTGERWWSDEFYYILGIAPQKRPPPIQAFLEHVHPHDVEWMKEMTAKVIKTGNEYGELRIIRSSGEELTTYWRAKVHYDEEGNPVRLIATLLDITERKQAEMKIQETKKQLQALSRQLITAQETNQRRIALELHDQLGQDLALSSIEIEQLMQNAPKSQAQQLQQLAMRNREISAYVQTLSHQLHPSSLEHLGLVAASRSLCHEVGRSSGIQIDFSHSDVPSPIPQDVSICFYRVLQESLTNIVKHGEVQAARVELAGSPDKLQLQVCDSGVGFDPESVGNDGGLGFVSMRERLSLVGGDLLIESQPLGGTQIKACVPLNSSDSPIEHPTEVQEA